MSTHLAVESQVLLTASYTFPESLGGAEEVIMEEGLLVMLLIWIPTQVSSPEEGLQVRKVWR